jgi:thioredoxin 1
MNFSTKIWLPVFALLATAAFIGCDKSTAMNESTANVTHITQAEFPSQVTGVSGAVVVDFYATWCGPCRTLAPMVEKAATTYSAKVKFFKVNIDESPGLAQNFQIEAIPTLLFFKDGQLKSRITGLPSEAELTAKLEALVAGGK